MAEAGRLSRVIRQVRPQVLHLHSSKAGLAGRLAARGRVPTVFQPHAWSFDAVTGPVRSASRWWEQRATRWTTLTLCVSADEAASGQRAGSLGRSNAVVPNGVDVHRWQPADRAEARARLGLPAEAPVAVLIGRLTRQKGQDLAVQAWPAVRAALPEALLCLVGDGPDAADLAATAEPGVRLVGRADPGDWYAASNVLLLPSRWEGMPLVALEAMACGRPVVGADVTGVAEALGDPNQLVPAERPEALAASTLALLTESDRAERIGARNRTRACQQFSVERMTQQVFQLYQDLLVR